MSLDSYGAERPGGKGTPGRLAASFRPGALGKPAAGHGGTGDSPGFQLLSLPPAQLEEGYLKTGTQAGPGEAGEGVKGDGRLGLQTSRVCVWGCVRPGAESWEPETYGSAGAGGARGYFGLSVSTFLPQLRSRVAGEGPEQGGDTDVPKQSFGPPLPLSETRGKERNK